MLNLLGATKKVSDVKMKHLQEHYVTDQVNWQQVSWAEVHQSATISDRETTYWDHLSAAASRAKADEIELLLEGETYTLIRRSFPLKAEALKDKDPRFNINSSSFPFLKGQAFPPKTTHDTLSSYQWTVVKTCKG